MDTNKDGKLTADDREYCGSSDPKIIYGFNINAGWKGIDLSLMFNGAAGVKRLFDGYEVYGNFSGDAAHPATIWRDAWTPDNHDASMPRIFTIQTRPVAAVRYNRILVTRYKLFASEKFAVGIYFAERLVEFGWC